MKILAIDTSTELCSAALYHDSEICSHEILAPREHTQRILPMVEDLLASSQLSLSQLDALAFGRGPGSFTGVRIGIGIAQGLAFGADLPMIGVSTLASMAQGVFAEHEAQLAYTAIDARMNEVYWAVYKNQQGLAVLEAEEQVIKPELITHRAVAGMMAVGTAWEAYSQALAPVLGGAELSNKVKFGNAKYMLPLALESLQQGLVVSPENAEPVYLRDTVTWKKLPGRE